MLNFIWRTPFALFGALGFLSLSTGGGVMQVDSNVQAWIEIWQSIAHPFWRFILWPIEAYFDFVVPRFVLDYLMIGLIVVGMTARSLAKNVTGDAVKLRSNFIPRADWKLREYLLFIVLSLSALVSWPIFLASYSYMTYNIIKTTPAKLKELAFDETLNRAVIHSDRTNEIVEEFESKHQDYKIVVTTFWETAIWFLLLIAINYALLYKDGELRWQRLGLPAAFQINLI